jgi:hypothetical protein
VNKQINLLKFLFFSLLHKFLETVIASYIQTKAHFKGYKTKQKRESQLKQIKKWTGSPIFCTCLVSSSSTFGNQHTMYKEAINIESNIN